MSNKEYRTSNTLLDRWIQENNDVVNKWKLDGRGDALCRDQNQRHLRLCASEFHKLLGKIQGLPPDADHIQLELSVVFNTCLQSLALSQISEAELLLTQTLDRVLKMTGEDHVASDLVVLWRTVLKAVGDGDLHLSVLRLLGLHWAIWLASCRFEKIEEIKGELPSLSETLSAEDDIRRVRSGKSSNVPLLVTDPRRLIELLQICTFIAQGAEMLNKGQNSEALTNLQTASTLPAPRILVAYTHFLSGSCLANMSRPQMALQCYRKALETDSGCICALYRSMLIYRHLGNTQAEIQALRLLHSTLMLPSPSEPVVAGVTLFSPSLLLQSQSLSSLLFVPPALTVLHSLALKCVLHRRVSEGVEHYLDLLAALHSENQQGARAEDPQLPRLPELYLEAGTALLMAQRPTDCMTLCDEVITVTLELLPERMVVVEEPEESSEPGSVCAESKDRVAVVLWTGAAYLLQGHCHIHLRDWKQAVVEYTRCINLLVKVLFKKQGCQPQIPTIDMVDKQGRDLFVLQRLKGLSLAWRGISFTQTDQLKWALRDLQLSLEMFPECVNAGLWCGEVLWRLGRKREAAARWEKTWNVTLQPSAGIVPVYLYEPESGPLLDSTELRHRIQELGPT